MKNLYIILLLLLSFLIRFWHGGDLFFWHVDEEIISLTAKRIIVEHRPQLIGFPIPGGVYIGPAIYYFIAIFYALSSMNPLGLPLFSALLGALTVFLVYFVGKTIFENREIGLFAAIFYAFSYLTNIYSHLFSGLTVGPILALLTYYLLYKSVVSNRQRYLLALTAVLIFASQNEGTTLSLLVLSMLCWIYFKFKVKIFAFIFLIFAFLASLVPLIIFDFRHNHFIIQSLLKFLASPIHTQQISGIHFEIIINAILILPTTMSRFLNITGAKNISDQILPCADLMRNRLVNLQPALLLLCFFVLITFILMSIRKKSVIGNKILLFHLLLIIFGILLFNLFLPGYFYEWMLVIFFPGIAFIFAIFIKNLRATKRLRWITIALILSLFVFVNVSNVFLTNSDFGLRNKTEAVHLALKKVRGRPFTLNTIGSCYSQGYIYLFWQQGQLPIKSYADEMFSSTLNLNPNNIKPEVAVVLVNPSNKETQLFYDQYYQYLQKSTGRFHVGKIQILILD